MTLKTLQFAASRTLLGYLLFGSFEFLGGFFELLNGFVGRDIRRRGLLPGPPQLNPVDGLRLAQIDTLLARLRLLLSGLFLAAQTAFVEPAAFDLTDLAPRLTLRSPRWFVRLRRRLDPGVKVAALSVHGIATDVVGLPAEVRAQLLSVVKRRGVQVLLQLLFAQFPLGRAKHCDSVPIPFEAVDCLGRSDPAGDPAVAACLFPFERGSTGHVTA